MHFASGLYFCCCLADGFVFAKRKFCQIFWHFCNRKSLYSDVSSDTLNRTISYVCVELFCMRKWECRLSAMTAQDVWLHLSNIQCEMMNLSRRNWITSSFSYGTFCIVYILTSCVRSVCVNFCLVVSNVPLCVFDTTVKVDIICKTVRRIWRFWSCNVQNCLIITAAGFVRWLYV